MKKILKYILIGFIGLVVLGAILDTSDKNSKTETSSNTTTNGEQVIEVIEVEITSFISEFDENQLAAEERYEDKQVKLSGYIKNISEDITGSPFLSINPNRDEYYFGTNIQCMFKEKSELTSLKNGQGVSFVGKVSSQSLGIIILKDCSVL
jgi:hypothetical protein